MPDASSNTSESYGGRQGAIPQKDHAACCQTPCDDSATCVLYVPIVRHVMAGGAVRPTSFPSVFMFLAKNTRLGRSHSPGRKKRLEPQTVTKQIELAKTRYFCH